MKPQEGYKVFLVCSKLRARTNNLIFEKISTNVWQQVILLKLRGRAGTIDHVRGTIFDCLRKSSVVETIRTVS